MSNKKPPKSPTAYVLFPAETEGGEPQKRVIGSATPSVDSQDPREVKRLQARPKVTSGKPRRMPKAASMKLGYVGGFTSGNTIDASAGNFYSPELSTDFLELPQSRSEQWAYYRFFYENNPFVGQAIDLHTELPLSKIRINIAEARDRDLAEAATRFCERWAQRVKLLHRLISIVHEYHLIGEVFIFAEDNNPDIPEDLLYEYVPVLTTDEEGNGVVLDEKRRKENNAEAVAWLKKHYFGWTGVQCLPPEQIMMEDFSFTREKIFEMVPDAKTRRAIDLAAQGDPRMRRVVESMPVDVVAAVREGKNIPLGTDPDAGSFVYYMANKKSDYAPRGKSILGRCLLPGTRVTALVDGVVRDLPVEEAVTIPHLPLLTHAGRFMPATGGSRPVDEEVVEVTCAGDEEHLSLTQEHPVLVVRPDGTEVWVEARDLKEGDVLRESHVVPQEAGLTEIDLVDWWEQRGRFDARRRFDRPNRFGNAAPTSRIVWTRACVRKPKEYPIVHPNTGGALFVQIQYEQDDASRVGFVEKMGRFLAWLQTLAEPVMMPRHAVAAATGISPIDVTNFSRRLVGEGVLRTETHSLGCGLGRGTTWYPVNADIEVPGGIVLQVECSPTSRIPLDEDMMYLLGVWLGGGSVWTSADHLLNTPHLLWSCHDQQVWERVAIIASRLGQVVAAPIIANPSGEVRDVRLDDPLLARWFYDEFGHDAATKRVPTWVFDLGKSQILALLKGVLDSDGTLSNSGIQVTLDNRVLVEQLHLLCSRVGLHTSVHAVEKPARTWTRTWATKTRGQRTKTYQYEAKTYWRLTCSRRGDVRAWAAGTISEKLVTWTEPKYAWSSRFTKDGFLTRRVTSVRRVPYQGLVYSFDVAEDQSLVASGVVVHNCLKTLVHWDKLRQANASIASRHMTPCRVVWAENMDIADIDQMREQIDMALQDPDFSIVTNFEVNWNEMGSEQRLLDLTAEMDMANRELYAGLGVTEGLLTGESSYSGDKISLEVINTRYMLLRELLQDFVEEYLFKPMCKRMGFVEMDDDGNERVIYPKLSFTRLAIRDNADTFEALYNLYSKGSLDIDVILELLNIDPVATRAKLKRDVLTQNDALFNEVLRSLYSGVGNALADPNQSDAIKKIAEALGLTFQKPKGEPRF